MYSVFGTLYSVLCIRYSVLSTLYSILCTQYSVLITLYSVLCTLYSALCTQYSVLSTLYSALCTQYSVLCTLYSVLSTLYIKFCYRRQFKFDFPKATGLFTYLMILNLFTHCAVKRQGLVFSFLCLVNIWLDSFKQNKPKKVFFAILAGAVQTLNVIMF